VQKRASSIETHTIVLVKNMTKNKLKILTLTSGAFSASASSSSFAGWERKLDALKSRLRLSSRLRGNTRITIKNPKFIKGTEA
jgi:hypothetical protein